MGTYLPSPIKLTTLKNTLLDITTIDLKKMDLEANCLVGCHTEKIVCTIGKLLPSTGTV